MKFAKTVIAALVLSATSFGVNAASFDCAKATSVSEKFICDNPSISVLDEKIAQAYKAAVKKDPNIRKEMREWNRNVRDVVIKTGSVVAVEAVYNEQIKKMAGDTTEEKTAPESTVEAPNVTEESKPVEKAEQPKAKGVTAELKFQCFAKFEWKTINGVTTKPKEDPFYELAVKRGEYGDLTVNFVDSQAKSFVYVDSHDVFMANLKNNGKNVFFGVQRINEFEFPIRFDYWFSPSDSTHRLNVYKIGGKVEQYVCQK